MNNEEEKRCPLCAEEMDWTDRQLKPCKCGYQVCVWCWHQIMSMAEKDETEGRCPACRTPYDKEGIVAVETKFERVVANNRKHRPPKAKPKTNEGKKDLTNVRVIQRKMAYVIGLPLSLADEDLLQQKEYFGQYGKVTKVSLSRTVGGTVQQFINDTCSVYITYSKEEEAIRCIQSVHGFELEGRFLRASFGTAKYCHAWLRNTPCNNPACLYLHSIGAEEDSFGKDEVAAVHTRTRVQQVVGATHDLQRRSGNVLPPHIDEHLNNSRASTNIPHIKSDLNDVAPSTVTSSGHLACLPSLQDKDGGVRPPDKMTSFVYMTGRPSSSGPEKDGSVTEEDGRILDTRSELSSASIYEDNQLEPPQADAMLNKYSTSSHLVNGLHRNREFKEPYRELSTLLALDGNDIIQHDPCSFVREDILSLDNKRMKDSQTAFLRPSYSPKIIEDSSDNAWQLRVSRGLNDYSAVRNTVSNHVSDACIQFTSVNPTPNDGYDEENFQSSAKSDRIYRGSNSFSDEEIVEHLRRLDDDDDDDLINDSENRGLDAVKSSIISNLLSLDLDACDESSTVSHSLVGSFDETDGRQGSSWNFQNSVQPGFSFLKPEGSASQLINLESSFSNIGQESLTYSGRQDPSDKKDHFFYKPHFNVSRAQNSTPPGFSLSSRETPPGFPACERTDQIFRATSGSHLVNNTYLPNHHYRTPSTGNSSSTSEVDLIDPAILVVGRGKQMNGMSNSCLDVKSAYPPQPEPSSYEDEARLWRLMQQSTSPYPDPKFPQTYMQQTPPLHQEPIYSGDGLSSWADMYGISSRLMNHQHPISNSSSFGQFSQQKFANGNVSSGCYQQGFDEVQHRSEAGIAEIERDESLGLNNYFPGYGDLMLQSSNSGDVYSRLFGR